MSGSEGEEDQRRPAGRRRADRRVPQAAGPVDAVDGLSSCSSLSSVHSSSPSDVDRHGRIIVAAGQPQRRRSADRIVDTMDGGPPGRVGENVYSRIKETGSRRLPRLLNNLFTLTVANKNKKKKQINTDKLTLLT